MSVRGLENVLHERGLLRTDYLPSCRLGIQADYWLTHLKINEPFYAAIGGTPVSLLPKVAAHLDFFRRALVKPVFVWNGLNVLRKDKPFSKPDKKAPVREQAWELYLSDKDSVRDLEQVAKLFGSQGTDKSLTNNFIPIIIRYLQSVGVETFTAPYQAKAQLSYFLQSPPPLIQHVYGSLELLLYGIPAVILEIDFQTGIVQWVDLYSILDSLQISFDQFLEISILAGFEFSQTFPPISEHGDHCWKAAYELVKQYGTGYNVVQQHINHPQVKRVHYNEIFLRAKHVVEHHMIFDRTGRCRSLMRTCPRDIQDLIGPRMHDQIYYLVSQSLVSPQVINNLASGLLVESCPLVDSPSYRETLNALMSLRTLTLGILSSKLHSSHRKRPVSTIRWYDSNSPVVMDHANAEKVIAKMGRPITESDLSETIKSRKITSGDVFNEVDFNLVMDYIISTPSTQLSSTSSLTPSASQPAALTPSSSPSASPSKLKGIKDLEKGVDSNQDIVTPSECLATVLLQTLQLRGFVVNNNLNPFGKALRSISPEFQEQAFILLELIQLKQLNGDRLVTSHVSLPYPKESEVALLTRVYTLLPIETQMSGDFAWVGPIDQELMAWNCVVKALYKSLRNLTEMTLTRLYLSGVIKFSDYSMFHKVTARLPFFQESSTVMGLVLKSILLEKTPDFVKRFPNCPKVKDDLAVGRRFWREVFDMISLLHTEQAITDSLFAIFKSSNDLLLQALSES